ncbi:restriction endonuclease subunit S [Faecalibacterium sp. I4-1-79]|uniref:restriction endonuclease subunit S n=1 Tax=Faecalibacterium sp. I4-1-79 TaxID=2929494 RepID=UPI00201502A9|nr:restriction endonuclease subunit S [Faecalibacterium sp. I4-1-79]UQK41516.1 restriction endonuclease subunit S [Faecalibacterium sp. I4-1-79]
MKWEKVKLGDICKYVTSGGTPKSSIKEYYEPKQIPWLKTKEVNYCRIYETESYISKDGLDNSSAKMIPQNSVIVAMYGQGDTAGRVAINKIPLTTNQACCNLIIDETKAYYEFVYYQLVTLYEKMVSLKNGGAQPNLNAAIIKSIEIKLPPLKTQRYIADILSAYDDLIENNQKQIKLLEEAAQRLYKEWFVDLRFPGHENTKIVDGIPEGWSRGLLKELISVNYGKDHKKAPDDGNIPVYGSGGLMRKCNKSLFSGEAVLIPRKGSLNNIMYVDETFWTVDTMFYATMKQPHTAVFVYFFVKAFDMYSMNIGAAVPSMTTKILDAMDVVIPDKETLEKFDKCAKTYFNKIKTLQGQNERLKTARNLLLPKLMSGETEV